MTNNEPHSPQPNRAHAQPEDNTNVVLLIGILVVAAFVVILNETTLTVALPVLMKDFGITPEAAQWLTTSFMVTMAVVIPTTGWVMQRFTLRSIYIFALLTFLAGTILAAVSPTFAVLLLARIIQACGERMGIPSEKVMVNIQRYGNTTGGTIPLCLYEWQDKLKKGDNVILAAVGGGFTWGAIYVKWAIG